MWEGAATEEDDSTEGELDEKDMVDGKFWKQQPQFDFLPKKVQVKFGENTPSRAIQDLDGKIVRIVGSVPHFSSTLYFFKLPALHPSLSLIRMHSSN